MGLDIVEQKLGTQVSHERAEAYCAEYSRDLRKARALWSGPEAVSSIVIMRASLKPETDLMARMLQQSSSALKFQEAMERARGASEHKHSLSPATPCTQL